MVSILTAMGPLSKLRAGNEAYLTTKAKWGQEGVGLWWSLTQDRKTLSLLDRSEKLIHIYTLNFVTSLPILFSLGYVYLYRFLAIAKEFVQMLTSGRLPFQAK